MQRVIVLGASGFVGGHVLAALASSGWAAPVAVSRRPHGSPRAPAWPPDVRHEASSPLAPVPTERLACDATRAADLLPLLQGTDAVVNCTAGSAADTVAVATALSQAPSPCRIVHLSSMAVYGPATGRVDEAAALPDGLPGYAGAKVAAERALSAHPGCVVLRPGCIFGPGGEQWTLRIARLLRARRLGDLGAAGDGTCNLSPIDDVAAAVLAALRRPVAGAAFNVALPDPPSWNAFLVRFAVALGATPVARIPSRQLRLDARLAVPLHVATLAARRIAPGVARLVPDALTPSLLALLRHDITLDHRRADDRLGFARTPLDGALAQAAASLPAATGRTIVPAPVVPTPSAETTASASRIAGTTFPARDPTADRLPASDPVHAE